MPPKAYPAKDDGMIPVKGRSKAYLVILQTWQRSKTYLEESTEEMKELTRSCSVEVTGVSQAHLPHPSPSHFLREGKLEEVRDLAKASGAKVLFFNVDLTPAQVRNIEKFTKLPAVDRTGLILDIFGRRAQTSEGKLQVELARLEYMLPRLGGLGVVFSRLGGGIGTRGPGETELETDRRKFRKRIQRVKEELKKVKKHRELLRAGRRRRNFTAVALVGYTNAGKSTLLNALTGASTYVEDKLFATLDTTTRVQTMNGRKDLLFIDTVGFLRDLPHGLIRAFHATLEEVSEADVLVHVLDASLPNPQDTKAAVEKVLEEIGAVKKPVILALNKADLLTEEAQSRIQTEWPAAILVSAREKLGLRSLLARIEELAPREPYLDPAENSHDSEEAAE